MIVIAVIEKIPYFELSKTQLTNEKLSRRFVRNNKNFAFFLRDRETPCDL